jgi:hypothetical protein
MVARFMVCAVLYSSTIGIIGSSPIRGHEYMFAFFCVFCLGLVTGRSPAQGGPQNICNQKYGRPWTSLVCIAEEEVTFYDSISVVGPHLETGHWQFLCAPQYVAAVAAPIPMSLIFMRDSKANRFYSDSCVYFCLERNNRNVGLYLARSNANLSKEFTLSRVLFCFHPEEDPPSFGQIVHTHGYAFFTLKTSRRVFARMKRKTA